MWKFWNGPEYEKFRIPLDAKCDNSGRGYNNKIWNGQKSDFFLIMSVLKFFGIVKNVKIWELSIPLKFLNV